MPARPPTRPFKAIKARAPKQQKRSPPPPSPQGEEGASFEPAVLLPHGLPPIHTQVSNHWLYLFFRFCAERHRMHVKRESGVARDSLTEDETLRRTFVGNVFRELDGGTKRMRRGVVAVGDQGNEEVCFRIFLFSGFYSDTTWKALVAGLGETPSWKSFDLQKYESILYNESVVKGEKIYFGGFQIVPPTVYFGRPHFGATLRFVMSLMEMGLPQRLLECRYAEDASNLLQTIPTLGGFMSWNLVCSLNNSPHLNLYYRNFASCGPGSKSYLQRIFGKAINSPASETAGLRWLYQNQWRYWARLAEDPPHAWTADADGLRLRPGMRVLDLENSLCWCHRYINDYQQKGYGNLAQKPHPAPGIDYDPGISEDAGPSAWCDDEAHIGDVSRAAWDGDYDEEKEKLQSLGEEVYEVERVVGRSRYGGKDDAEGPFRVRWKGYPPEDDTWESATTLLEDASEALENWLTWEKLVWSTIRRVSAENPYQGPAIPVTVVKSEIVESGSEVTCFRATRKRAAATATRNVRRRISKTAIAVVATAAINEEPGSGDEGHAESVPIEADTARHLGETSDTGETIASSPPPLPSGVALH